jgi:hypothetical protein
MVKGIIQHITELFKNNHAEVLLIENNDKFLYREDVKSALKENGIDLINSSSIQQRIQFELREKDTLLVLLSQDNTNYLEDIKASSISMEFHLEYLYSSYHIPSIIELDLFTLDKLLILNQLITLNKQETIKTIQNVQKELNLKTTKLVNLQDFVKMLDFQLASETKNWRVICRIISNGILNSIGTNNFDDLYTHVNYINGVFQETIQSEYKQLKNSNSVKSPKIVSKILDYLSFNFLNKKVALFVVDGLALWQYELLRDNLPNNRIEEVIYSWIPSITQLSRQAIFRGDNPITDYKQGPTSEEKLWNSYWKSKGINDFQVRYNHDNIDFTNLEQISKFAIVFKDLDEKMHSSSDYKDLLTLTQNWIERSKIISHINKLRQLGFNVFLTTDHGNLQAKGWRSLKGREKLGTNKSGSRSDRHIEYTEKWLSDEFIANNPEIKNSIVTEEQSIYFKSDLSFSRKETHVTHGGSHLLEVLIPFIEIIHE